MNTLQIKCSGREYNYEINVISLRFSTQKIFVAVMVMVYLVLMTLTTKQRKLVMTMTQVVEKLVMRYLELENSEINKTLCAFFRISFLFLISCHPHSLLTPMIYMYAMYLMEDYLVCWLRSLSCAQGAMQENYS